MEDQMIARGGSKDGRGNKDWEGMVEERERGRKRMGRGNREGMNERVWKRRKIDWEEERRTEEEGRRGKDWEEEEKRR